MVASGRSLHWECILCYDVLCVDYANVLFH